MNRNTLRIFGIIVGALAGTIVALASRGLLFRPNAQTEDVSSQTSFIEVEETDPASRAVPPDPGRRNELKELVASAKKEEQWLKEFELTERTGRKVTSEELRGEPYIACFFFTTCPGTCTRQSNQMQLLQNKLRGKPIKFVSITVDPEIDTPEVLRDYADKYDADPNRWLFLTGDLEYIIRVGTEKFFLSGVEKRGHPDRFCLVNAEGDIVGSYVWLDLAEREALAAHVNELLGTNPREGAAAAEPASAGKP